MDTKKIDSKIDAAANEAKKGAATAGALASEALEGTKAVAHHVEGKVEELATKGEHHAQEAIQKATHVLQEITTKVAHVADEAARSVAHGAKGLASDVTHSGKDASERSKEN